MHRRKALTSSHILLLVTPFLGSSNYTTPTLSHSARATLELKAYDPESGVVLKFKTNRAAEVGRLMLGLGSLGRYMAALPVKEEGMRILKMAFGGGLTDHLSCGFCKVCW